VSHSGPAIRRPLVRRAFTLTGPQIRHIKNRRSGLFGLGFWFEPHSRGSASGFGGGLIPLSTPREASRAVSCCRGQGGQEDRALGKEELALGRGGGDLSGVCCALPVGGPVFDSSGSGGKCHSGRGGVFRGVRGGGWSGDWRCQRGDLRVWHLRNPKGSPVRSGVRGGDSRGRAWIAVGQRGGCGREFRGRSRQSRIARARAGWVERDSGRRFASGFFWGIWFPDQIGHGVRGARGCFGGLLKDPGAGGIVLRMSLAATVGGDAAALGVGGFTKGAISAAFVDLLTDKHHQARTSFRNADGSSLNADKYACGVAPKNLARAHGGPLQVGEKMIFLWMVKNDADRGFWTRR
jgi:hypothetical protein